MSQLAIKYWLAPVHVNYIASSGSSKGGLGSVGGGCLAPLNKDKINNSKRSTEEALKS